MGGRGRDLPETSGPTTSSGDSSRNSSFSSRTVDESTRQLKRQRNPRSLASAPAKPLPPDTVVLAVPAQGRTCRVPGCMAELAAGYHFKYRICSEHYAAASVMVGAQACRFCQQCSKIHGVKEFEGDRRSCRASLERHQQRRLLRKRRADSRHRDGPQGRRDSKRRSGEKQAQQELHHGTGAELQSLQAQQRGRQQPAGARPSQPAAECQAAGSAALLRPVTMPGAQWSSWDVDAAAAEARAAATEAAIPSAHASASDTATLQQEQLWQQQQRRQQQQEQQQQEQQQRAAAMQAWLTSPFRAPGMLPPVSSHAVEPLPLREQLQRQLLQMQAQAVLRWQAQTHQREEQPPQAGALLPPALAAAASQQLAAPCCQALPARQAGLGARELMRSASNASSSGPLEGAPTPRRDMVQRAMELLQLDMPLCDYVPSELELELLNRRHGLGQLSPAGTPAARPATAAPLGIGGTRPLLAMQASDRQDPAAPGCSGGPAAAAAAASAAAAAGRPGPLAAIDSAASLPLPGLPACTAVRRGGPAALAAGAEVSLLPPQHAQQGQQHLGDGDGDGAAASWLGLPPLPALSSAPAVPLPAGGPLSAPEAADWLSRFLL